MPQDLHVSPKCCPLPTSRSEERLKIWSLSVNKKVERNNGNVQMWKMISAVVTHAQWSILDMGRY